MINHIGTVWKWYKKRSPWIKWALFIFVIVVILLMYIFYAFFPPMRNPYEDEEVTTRVKVRLEKKYSEDLKKTTRLDAGYAEEIAKEAKVQVDLEKAKERNIEEGKEAHDEIDSADDFDAVDRAIREYRRRHRIGERSDDD